MRQKFLLLKVTNFLTFKKRNITGETLIKLIKKITGVLLLNKKRLKTAHKLNLLQEVFLWKKEK